MAVSLDVIASRHFLDGSLDLLLMASRHWSSAEK